MIKKILLLTLGFLLVCVNLYAAGDLVVNGKLGVGTNSPLNKLHVEAGNDSRAVKASINITTDPIIQTNVTAFYQTISSQMGATTGRYIGYSGTAVLTGDGVIGALGGAENVTTFNTSTGTYTVPKVFGNMVELRRGSVNNQNHVVTDYYGFYSKSNPAPAGSGSISGSDWRHAYFSNFADFGGTVSKVSGLWIDKQTSGSSNYGIVLNGDGEGADIVFGSSQEARIYSSGGELFAEDGASNVTQISPHDPETGEWIFYSKNVKTGRTIRVNMEKLVEAVEELTGEQFMLETTGEIQ